MGQGASDDTDRASGAARVHVPEGFLGRTRPAPDLALAMDGGEKRAVSMARERLSIVALCFIFVFSVLSLRLVDVAAFGEPPIASAGSANQAMRPVRAEITDRNGRLLATNLETVSVAVRKNQVLDEERLIRLAALELDGVSEEDIRRKFAAGSNYFFLKRKITPREHQALFAHGLVGLEFQPEIRRAYPHGALVAHIVGFSDVDNRGLAGVERTLDERLVGNPDQPVALTIDLRIQNALMRELAQAVVEFRAQAAAGIVLDVKTGEVLGLVSLPTYDPEEPTQAPAAARRNRAVGDRYEMGSTFKAFTAAMALDSGRVGLSTVYDATHPIKIGRFTIRDFHAKRRPLTVPEVIMYSSNIGTAKMALEIPSDTHQSFLRRMGLLQESAIELSEAARPLAPRQWGEVERMTVAFGHGIAVTPIHVATAIGAVVNGGVLVPATLLPRNSSNPVVSERVISEETSAVMRGLLRLVVEHGTGRKADVPGLLVLGKTGTAEKSVAGGYARSKKITSFAGGFPAHDPAYALVIMLDDPKGNRATHGFSTSGWNAAPTAGKVIRRIAPLLGVRPVDEGMPAVEEVRALSTLVGLKLAGHVE